VESIPKKKWSKPGIPGLALLVFLLSAAPFLQTLEYGFVWDDHYLVEKNTSVNEPGRILLENRFIGRMST
jgi:hypothetical protein